MSQITLPENAISVLLFRLADGTLIDPLTREPVNQGSSLPKDDHTKGVHSTQAPVSKSSKSKEVEIIEEDEDEELHLELAPLSRRSLHDITIPKKQMAVVCMAIMYKNWGLPDDEIALAIGITPDALDHVRNLDMYIRLETDLIESLRAAYMQSVEGVFQKASLLAAKKMVSMVNSHAADIAIASAKDVLDRSGHRPADKIEHSIRMEQDLTIRILRQEDEEKHFQTIDMEAL